GSMDGAPPGAEKGIDELEGLEGNQVGGADVDDTREAPILRQERPLSGSEFAAIPLQESSVRRVSSTHDLVLPTGLPMLGGSEATEVQTPDFALPPAEGTVSQYSASAEGLLLGDTDFGSTPESSDRLTDEARTLDSDSPIAPEITGETPAVAAKA